MCAAIKMLPSLKLIPGVSLDLTTSNEAGEPWDFAKASKRKEAEDLLEDQKPMLLVGGPIRTAFSSWQYLNSTCADSAVVARKWT